MKILIDLKRLTKSMNYELKITYRDRLAKLGQIQEGLQRAIQNSTKGGGVAIIFFYFLRIKNRTF